MSAENVPGKEDKERVPVILRNVTGKEGRSITIGIGTWPPPELTVFEGGLAEKVPTPPAGAASAATRRRDRLP